MHEMTLNFNQEDEGLVGLSGKANFRAAGDWPSSVTIGGLGEWRHVPANIIHVNELFIEKANMAENSQKLAKIGMNWIGIKARTNLMLAHSLRKGRNGPTKVKLVMEKFFKALGATSVIISVE